MLDQEKAVFTCAAVGLPAPTIRWKWSHLPTPPVIVEPVGTAGGMAVESTLEFQAMLDINQTTVYCTISNIAGDISRISSLLIAGRSTILIDFDSGKNKYFVGFYILLSE